MKIKELIDHLKTKGKKLDRQTRELVVSTFRKQDKVSAYKFSKRLKRSPGWIYQLLTEFPENGSNGSSILASSADANTDFEVFDGQMLKRGKPKVTLNSNGVFTFNSQFVHQHSLEKSKYVILFHKIENSTHVIGFRFLSEEQPNSLKLSKGTGERFLLVSKSFLNRYGIRTSSRIELVLKKIMHQVHGEIYSSALEVKQ